MKCINCFKKLNIDIDGNNFGVIGYECKRKQCIKYFILPHIYIIDNEDSYEVENCLFWIKYNNAKYRFTLEKGTRIEIYSDIYNRLFVNRNHSNQKVIATFDIKPINFMMLSHNDVHLQLRKIFDRLIKLVIIS